MFKTNIFAFIKTIFMTPTFFLANTSNRFFAHFLCFFSPWLSGFLDYLGLQTALWEILRILCENLWRNKLPKLTTLNPIFQLLHSALMHNGKDWKLIILLKTHCQDEVRNQSRSWMWVKVVKWCLKKWNEYILIYSDILPKPRTIQGVTMLKSWSDHVQGFPKMFKM